MFNFKCKIMKTVNIHGKQYVEVNERIIYFRKNYKEWSLISEIVELTDKRCVIKASILNEQGRVLATGIAYEIHGSTYINKTSFVENCETSAWGRALGNLGIGIETSIASSDEVKTAIEQQESKPKKKLDKNKYEAMVKAIAEGKIDVVKKRMDNYKLTKKQERELNSLILKKKDEISDPIIMEELGIVKAFREYNNI